MPADTLCAHSVELNKATMEGLREERTFGLEEASLE